MKTLLDIRFTQRQQVVVLFERVLELKQGAVRQVAVWPAQGRVVLSIAEHRKEKAWHEQGKLSISVWLLKLGIRGA